MGTLHPPLDNVALSSSPAFGTPLHPIPPTQHSRPPPPPPAFKPSIPTILPILLPPPTLRPLAFRTFTKKHNLTLQSSALQSLATFVGRHCGSGWREEGTGEKLLEEVARLWKAESGGVIVEDGAKLKGILKTLEGCMSGGRIVVGKGKGGSRLSRENSFAFGNDSAVDLTTTHAHRPGLDVGGGRNSSFGLSGLHVSPSLEADSNEDDSSKDPRAWLKVISAFDQPRFTYDVDKKHFQPLTTKPSAFPPPSHKTNLFRDRYNIIHQRLLRNPAFQTPTFSAHHPSHALSRSDTTTQSFYKITPIANLLGRGGTNHLLLGQLVIAPTGTLALNDLSGSISLSLEHAQAIQGEDAMFFVPGMIVLVDGVYEEDFAGAGSSGLGNTGGVGGTIGGRFVGFSIGGPPVEKRNVSLGVDVGSADVGLGGGFGWTDFLGVGAERAIGSRMRRLERRCLSDDNENMTPARRKVVVMSEVLLDQPATLTALRHILTQYLSAAESPLAFILMGNFTSRPALSSAKDSGSIEYKELFNSLAAVLADFPTLLTQSSWIFVPGDNDPWTSAFAAGASTIVPREGVPDVFTSRIKRAFATAKAEAGVGRREGGEGEGRDSLVWTSNPARVSLFGPAHEVCVFRDDMVGRMRRNAIRIGQASKVQHQDQPTAVQGTESLDGDEGLGVEGALPSTADISQDDVAMDLDPPLLTNTNTNPRTTTPSDENYAITQAKKLILSLLPQSTLSPFPLATRPVHWDLATSALTLYPLPHTLILADAEMAPFAVTFEGCHVVNPGRLVKDGGTRGRGKGKVQWCEYDVGSKRGVVREG